MAKELLKEAIADAKAVREVALQNAKMALEEAFDSKIKNMLSARLAEELEEDVELEEEYVEEEVETTDEAVETTDEGYYEKDDKDAANEEVELEEDIDEEINLDELMAELEEMSYMEDDDEPKKEGMDKYEEDDVKSEAVHDEDDKKNESIDIDALISEIESELSEESNITEEDNMDKIEKMAKKLGIKVVDFLKAARDFQIPGIAPGMGRQEEGIDVELEEAKDKEEKKQIEEELAEALSTVTALQETISEMNLLNSKLLYCNKLFRANSLNESQKVKVVDALDKATTTGEAKLVFETLQESFAFTGVEKRAIKEGLGRASKPAGVAPKKVLSESVDETVSRFQKLANINK